MNIINVSLKENPHKIVIGKSILEKIGPKIKSLKIGKDAVIITNPAVYKFHGKALAGSLRQSGFSVKVLEVPAGERSKSARVAFRLIEKIARYDVYKKVFIIAFGGGVIGDLAGYVAAAYKRGVPYVQVPTTFLAQIDSAIGGKVAVDLPVGKNLIGAFYQPELIYSDVATLSTLSRRQMRNGMAEAVKYGIIGDRPLFNYLEKNFGKVLDADLKTLDHVVARCARDKVKIVLADEKETRGIRTVLNFGHTIGHALEAAAGYKAYHHGEAIALGMRVAVKLSCALKLLKPKDARRINVLLSNAGLPEKIKNVRFSRILDIMKHDKKFVSGKNRFVLAERIGTVKVVEGIALSKIRSAVNVFC